MTRSHFNISLMLCFVPLLFYPSISRAEQAFSKPRKLRAMYESSGDKILVTWKPVSGAVIYRIVFRDTVGTKILQTKSSTAKKKVPGADFVASSEYTVKVKALKVGSKRASRFASSSYVHQLSRGRGKGNLVTANSVGRKGSYYLPKKFASKPIPVMVAFHGTGGTGRTMVNAFTKLAAEYGFIIIAPSSRYSPEGVATWEIGTSPNEFTEDFTHTRNCIEEVSSYIGVEFDSSNILAIGYSAGGSVAPYFSTNNPEFTNFAILHGGVFIGGLGERKMPAWLSTGLSDTLRPPAELQGYVSSLTADGFSDVMFTTYDTDHGLAKAELREVVEWWLSK